MDETLSQIWANDLYRKLILSVTVWLASIVARRLLHVLIIDRLPDDSAHVYVVGKVANYAVSVLVVLLIVAIWAQRLGDLSVALGILAAGLAFALQEVIGSIAGWATILGGRPFTIGDRIETGGIRGDVVDISVLRTTLMEIGNWLGGDHNTGRIVTVSNAFIFKEPLFNYSRHLRYIWDEVEPARDLRVRLAAGDPDHGRGGTAAPAVPGTAAQGAGTAAPNTAQVRHQDHAA